MLLKICLRFLLLFVVGWFGLTSPSWAVVNSPYYSYRQPSFDGIGKYYMGREISGVMGHQGAGWLERSERGTEEQPQKIVTALGLHSTDIVADVGAGTGYISQLLSAAVPEGRVMAIDIQPEMIELLDRRLKKERIHNIEPHLGTEESPGLAPNTIDVAVMVDAYHEFSYPHEMMAGIVESLKPGGRVVLAEYRGEDPLVFIKPHHKTTQKQIRRELESLGLTWQKTDEVLPQQHLLFFTKS